MNNLPVLYYNSKKAWSNLDIFQHWFFKKFIPAVRKFEGEEIGIPQEDAKCLLILDNSHSHLSSEDGKLDICFCQKNKTSLI